MKSKETQTVVLEINKTGTGLSFTYLLYHLAMGNRKKGYSYY